MYDDYERDRLSPMAKSKSRPSTPKWKKKKKPRKKDIPYKVYQSKKRAAEHFSRIQSYNPTKYELILKAALEEYNIPFVFQYPFTDGNRIFVFDFMIKIGRTKLCIEVDGGIHRKQFKKDLERTKIIEKNKFKVLRFSNQHVERDTESVIGVILSRIPQNKRIHTIMSDIETSINNSIYGT